MPNPWLTVPLSDYEGHMSSLEVHQLTMLSDLFGEALALIRPASLAVLGVAGGNGLDRIDSHITKRVVGIDIHAGYLETTRERHAASLPGLELLCTDLAAGAIACEPVELVHAALVFEHAGTGRCLDNALALVAPRGALSVVLQLPSTAAPGVSATRFPSVQGLARCFEFVDPSRLQEAVEARGYRLTRQSAHALRAGKSFWFGVFVREANSSSRSA